MSAEFARPVALDAIGNGRKLGIEAGADECAALARRFGWRAVHALSATVQLLPRAGGYDALGTLAADIERACVASGDPVQEHLDEAFGLHFVPVGQLAATPDEEVELDEDALDIVEYEGGAIDVGEAVAQSLALAVDPYPRSPDAEARLRSAGVIAEGEEPGPFAALKDLLKR